MLERFRKKSVDEGAESRTSKQSSTTEPVHIPEGQFSLADFARGSGVSRYKSGLLITALLEGNVIETVSSSKKRKLYQIIGRSPNPSKVTEPTVPDGSEEEDIDYVKITNALIWQFIRETRTTDVLIFLTWLERKGKA